MSLYKNIRIQCRVDPGWRKVERLMRKMIRLMRPSRYRVIWTWDRFIFAMSDRWLVEVGRSLKFWHARIGWFVFSYYTVPFSALRSAEAGKS